MTVLEQIPAAAPYRLGGGFTLEQLRRVRGALFSARGPVSIGPRPLQNDNIISWSEYANGHYADQDAACAFAKWAACRYTHAAVGPFIDAGYHGQVPPSDFRTDPDAVVRRLETMRDRGIVVIGFLATDNWTLDQMRTLEPIFRSPRWQAALPIVVPHGFEPSADTSNAEHIAWCQWARDVFPNALVGLHMPTNMDAPGNNDDFTPGRPGYIGMAEAWRRIAPHLHVFYGQYGPFTSAPADDPQQAEEWRKVFLERRFKTGRNGWPTRSAFGPTTPIDHVAAEYSSYSAWWKNLPERACQQWGDLALEAGADGALDGCFAV